MYKRTLFTIGDVKLIPFKTIPLRQGTNLNIYTSKKLSVNGYTIAILRKWIHYFFDTEYLFSVIGLCELSLTCSIHWWCVQPQRDSASPSVWHSQRQVPPVIPRPLWYPHCLQINRTTGKITYYNIPQIKYIQYQLYGLWYDTFPLDHFF